MIGFLWKGLVRDRSRSLLPIIVIAIGTFLTVTVYCWMKGVFSDMLWANAAFQTGHAKVITNGFDKEASLLPNDLAVVGVDSLLNELETIQPNMFWTPRIRFGGLLDIPDESGETRSQAPVMGMAVQLLHGDKAEHKILNLENALVSGRLPEAPGEILISHQLAQRLGAENGAVATLISSSMYGSMVMYNFTIVGTIKFGVGAVDRGAMVADIADIQYALDMTDAASEIVGIYRDRLYRANELDRLAAQFNNSNYDPDDEFSLIMKTLKDQNGLGEMLDMYDRILATGIFIFMAVMSVVLWNAGLMSSLRRYGEIGVRLAMGEDKRHVYGSLIVESILLGFVGTIIGAGLGALFSLYLQVHGIDVSSMMRNSSVLMSSVMRAQLSVGGIVAGFIPGFLAPVIGTMLSGIGIYRRQTSQLFKELET